MSFDALTLTAVRQELEPLLCGARIQKLAFADELTLAIETFRPEHGRAHVLLSADPNQSRVQLTPSLPARGMDSDTPFSLVARKHLRSARIFTIRQPRLERVLELDCEQRDASGQHYRLTLIVEAMGRRSNLLLVDADGIVIDAARRSPPSRNPRRPVLPHLPYVAPPPQDRLMPEGLDSLPPPPIGLAKYLAEHVAGLSPTTAREIAHLAAGLDWARTLEIVRTFVTSNDWRPSVAYDGDQPVEYAPFELTHMPRFERFDSISAAMDVYYARPQRRGDPLAAERKNLLAPIEKSLTTTERRVAALEHQLANADEGREPLRRAGELILTYQAQIEPGATSFDVDGQRVELDSTLSPSDNAQAYFARYRKAREAEARVPQLLEEARNRIAHLRDLRALIQVADSMDAIRALRREVADKPSPTTSKGPYRRLAVGDGWDALVGTSANGNAAVTFQEAGPNDLWLHARGVPGAHVILRGHGEPSNAVLERAAQLAAWYSEGRDNGAVEVDITQRRYVKKIPEAPPGLVRYSNERTVRVTPKG